MADFRLKQFSSSEGLLWLTDSSYRKTLGGSMYGLCSKKTWDAYLDGTYNSGGFRRTPFLKSVSFKSGGQVVRKMPITADFARGYGSDKAYFHPLVDKNYGICCYGLNIQGTSIDKDVLSELPYASATAVYQGWAKSVSGAVAWMNPEGTLFSMMPSTLTSNKKKGPLYDLFDNTLHIGNGFAPIYNNHNVIASDDGTFPFYYYTTATKTIAHREQVCLFPSMWAVVHCVNCAPYGMGRAVALSDYYEMNQYFPEMNVNEFDNVYFRVRAGKNVTVYPDYKVNGSEIYRTQLLWSYPHDSNESVWFLWREPTEAQGTWPISYGNVDTGPAFISPPIIGVVPAPVQELGQKMEVRILQYGVEFNL
ncbi:MAG: hypothetical protein J6W54_03415 [Fibrobacter sp.]|uniref:hypothetical protein n=1 Tax=Fibrobacter sp. TaxID=35828 RepID=UPI001B001249|nr:hypothetical protein [Fibrobacter sp.]MBO7060132.1 hypothetical protein [Fibrobacter sp.]